MASIFNDALSQLLHEQPEYLRRKDSITSASGTVLQLTQLLAIQGAGLPLWVNLIVGVVIGVAQILVHAGTKGAVTPSMAKRLEEAGRRAHMDRMSLSNPQAVSAYEGQHRMKE